MMEPRISAVAFLRLAFPGIRVEEAQEMNLAGDMYTYPAGTILCHEDCIESTFYVLLDGEVQVTKRINDKETRLLKVLHPGDFFGEMALIHNAPRAASCTTITEVQVLEVQKEDFRNLLEKSNILSLTMVREVSRRLRENDRMAIEDLRVKARELAQAYQQLAEQEYARSEFLTRIAHELRTPLTTASGYLQVIRAGMVQGEALDSALDTVGRNLQEIIALVNDILFLQEMELIPPEAQPTDMGQVTKHGVERLRSRAAAGGVTFMVEITPEPCTVLGDARGLERAVMAILDNAVKFSPDGGEVRAVVRREGEQVVVEVQDHGVGIAPDVLPHIFERFYHVEEIGAHLFRGAGIGLSIAQAVIEQHGGQIEVESTPAGSIFQVRLPAGKTGEQD